MHLHRIMVPIDFSHSSDAALKVATALARDMGATLFIVHVETIPLSTGGGEFMYAIPAPPTDELLAKLEEVHPGDPSVAVEHRLLAGDPAEAINRFAESENMDIIVMGTHGRRGLTRLLMGSVAEVVVRSASCPVLTIRQPARVAALVD